MNSILSLHKAGESCCDMYLSCCIVTGACHIDTVSHSCVIGYLSVTLDPLPPPLIQTVFNFYNASCFVSII